MDLLGLGNLALGIIEKVIPDPQKKAEALLELEKLKQNGELAQLAAETDLAKGQLEINKIEAGSSSFFVAGWRPMVGWIGAFSLAYASILEPMARFVAKVCFGYSGFFPEIDTTITMQLLFAILGVAGMRSFDKMKGTSK